MSIPLKMNKYIADYNMLDYSGNLPDKSDIRLDCSLGVNQSQLANRVYSALQKLGQLSETNAAHNTPIKDYPHDDAVKDKLVEWYNHNGVGNGWLGKNNIILGNGSIDILRSINMLTLSQGKQAMGHAPQFNAYVDNARCTGAEYDAYYMKAENNYRFDAEAYASQMSDAHDVFIVENPVTPFGQILQLHDIQMIAEKALSLGTILIVDEAYGEYMPLKISAINLVPQYPNIVVTRSFSKGFGMAGIRLGYAVCAAAEGEGSIINQLEKVQLSFNANSIARIVAIAALEAVINGDEPGNTPYDPFGLAAVAGNKRRVIEEIGRLNKAHGKCLKIAETSASTPIMVLYYENAGTGFDLFEYFAKHGLLTVTCAAYLGMDKRAVRIMLPKDTDIPLLLEIVGECIVNLPAE